MNYPVWEVPFLGGGMLIGIIAVFHVFISHFAVGGGLFLVLSERKAYRENNAAMLEYVKRHSKFFLLLTVVLGAVTGVAIWFTIGLVHPAGTSALIHAFVWGWAIEWTFFLVEITSILVYVAMWDRMDRRAHMTVGWIYAGSSFLTLAVINGIVSFMLTPGAWLETHNFWDGVFNPTYLPSLLARTLIAVGFAGVYAFLTGSRLRDAGLKVMVLRYSAKWALPALLLLPAVLYWYFHSLPEIPREIATGGLPAIESTMRYGMMAAAALLVLVVAGPLLRARSFTFAEALLILVLTSLSLFAAERVREAIRKPYIIHGYMYANGLLAGEGDSMGETGILASAKWVSATSVTPANELTIGRELFRVGCASCHTVNGYQSIVPLVQGRTAEELDVILSDLSSFAYMPPFGATEAERRALTRWLLTLAPPAPAAVPEGGK